MAKKSGFTFLIQRESVTPGTYTTVASTKDISGPNLSVTAIDATDKGSANSVREFLGGLIDGGEVSANINYDPNAATHASITTDFKARTVANWRVLFADSGEHITFPGLVTLFNPTGPMDDMMTADFTVKVAGDYTIAT